MAEFVVQMAQVESIDDISDGLRIKARMDCDKGLTTNDLPYSFPLLPKTFQTMPKVGEGVLIITAELKNGKSNRYYIGPIISQSQYFEKDEYDYGRGTDISLLQGSSLQPLKRLSDYSETHGSFPNKEDVALVGRKSEDVILKDGEIDIRCGIRQDVFSGDDNLKGNVVFNSEDPAYIQLKYKPNLAVKEDNQANSMVNLVADKVNIITHKQASNDGLKVTDNKELIKSEDFDNIMDSLHKLPYGDLLVDALNLIRRAVLEHFHPYPGMPPCVYDSTELLSKKDFNEILSNNVRIN